MTDLCKTPFFHPWVGRGYASRFRGARTLVLGESHYLWKGYAGRNESRAVVQITSSEGPKNRFWQQLSGALLGHIPDPKEAGELWDSLAFCNLVQEPMQECGRRPRVRQWRAGAKPFLDTIEALEPELVLVLGKEVWSWLPCCGRDGPPLRAGGRVAATYVYELSDGRHALAVSFPHPSAGFGRFAHRPLVEAAFHAAERMRTAG